ncbi:chemotaxis protein [Piscirickettsia litoralis]|uniref:Chemotaxis protein CheW n=1 Tax=Piscirickettsia litoralis TaxID=1891921 RepID=A0ABX3A4D1_9GAMM|nr:chemotaxis protein [Piscirickettsia litoralis]ODN43380.1 chemotaxis protein CheW [Piscirickettsia litoralis]
MAGVLDTVDARTQLVGKNRLESLLFKLYTDKVYAMNVFKIREVLQPIALTNIPESHPYILGVAHIRGQAIPVIDLGRAVGMQSLVGREDAVVVISEYYGSIQGFLVGSVERIINIEWNDIREPPDGLGESHYLTATVLVDEEIVEVLDVEKVYADIVCPKIEYHGMQEISTDLNTEGLAILVVDDSSFARSHLCKILSKINIEVITKNSGAAAFDFLREEAYKNNVNVAKKYPLVITDAEMPEMDGYTLTVNCRNDPKLKDLYLVLHTSLSGGFNKSMVEKVGCDDFIPKFDPRGTVELAVERIQALSKGGSMVTVADDTEMSKVVE